MTGFIMFLVIILVVILLILIACIKIVPQSKSYIVERLGRWHATWSAGIHVLVPFLDRIPSGGKITLKEQVFDFPPQAVITKDNVTMQIDTVVYFQVTDPKLLLYGIDRPVSAIENLTATTLRNIIGDFELDESLTGRDTINTKMREILDEATDKWGIKINRVELKKIVPPADIQNAMEKQMRAEREKRAAILTAEGEKNAAILSAEGQKESAILRAQGIKEKTILEAEGKAEAIFRINEATAKGLTLIKEVQADSALIALKSIESVKDLANGQATKLIVPSNLTDVATIATSIKELISDKEPSNTPK